MLRLGILSPSPDTLMSLIDSLRSAFKSSNSKTSSGPKKTVSRGKIDVEARFSRQRTAVTGTMANFFVAKDHENDDRLVGVKVVELEKYNLFESRFKGLKKKFCSCVFACSFYLDHHYSFSHMYIYTEVVPNKHQSPFRI